MGQKMSQMKKLSAFCATESKHFMKELGHMHYHKCTLALDHSFNAAYEWSRTQATGYYATSTVGPTSG